MDPLELLKALRRRWIPIVLTVVIALGLAYATTSVAPVGVGPAARSYKATAVLLDLRSPTFGTSSGIDNLKTIAALVTVGDVPIRAAKALNSSEQPQALAGRVSASADVDSGLLSISATSTAPHAAEQIANTFAVELLGFLRDRKAVTISEEAQSILAQLGALDHQVQRLDAQIQGLQRPPQRPGSRIDLVQAERVSKIRQYGFLSDRYQELTSQSAGADRFLKIQDAAALPEAVSGFRPPRTTKSRVLFGGILGLLLGIGLALVLERLDTRIRSKEQAETHFGFPVLAELPVLPRRGRRTSESAAAFNSGPADAFRLLGAGVMANGSHADRTPGPPDEPGAKPARVILVTSATSAEGKSTVVAHLAAVLGNTGRRVLVLSCDLRRPTVHSLLGVPNEEGMVEVLSENGNGRLDGVVHETKIPKVSLVSSGHANGRLRELLDSDALQRIIWEARTRADVVLVDTAPILTGDPAALLSAVDSVVVVARVGKTSIEVAERAGDLLRRLDAPVVGVALNGSRDMALPKIYYRQDKVAIRSKPLGDH